MSRDLSNSDEVIDSRDVIARIEELRGERADLESEAVDHTNAVIDEARAALAAWDEEYGDELKALEALAEEGGGSPDWPHGETLIRRSYFKDYAEELAEDIGAVNRDASWPNNYIDWDRAADALEQDYFTVDYDGVEYLIRA